VSESWGFRYRRYRVTCRDCGWKGYRIAHDCECYEDWVLYCRPTTPGPGCPSWVTYPCPKGHDAVAGKKVEPAA
jgi:hypothetical protein